MARSIAHRALIALVFRGASFHDPFHGHPVMRSENRSPFDQPSLGCEQCDARLWHLERSLDTALASGNPVRYLAPEPPSLLSALPQGLPGKARKCQYLYFPPAKGDAHGRDADASCGVDLSPRIGTAQGHLLIQ